MEHKKLFKPFRRRLFWQSLGRSALWGIGIGATAAFLFSFVWHLLLQEPPLWMLGTVLGTGFLSGFLPCLIATFPTRKRIARRLDASGLQERAGTMLAYEKQDGLLVELQRKDATEHIKKTAPRQLKAAFPTRLVLICLLCVTLCCSMLLLPYDLFTPASAADPETQAREQQVRDLIDGLREQVRQAELSAQMQAELEAILDQLEQELLNARSEMEQAALIQQAQQDISDVMVTTISRFIIGRALQQFGMTRDLGEQFTSDRPTDISPHMDKLENQLIDNTRQISRLSTNIASALETVELDESDELYAALMKFSTDLDDLTTPNVQGPDDEIVEGVPIEIEIATAFEIAEENIIRALEEQAHTESEIDEVSDSLGAGLQDLTGMSQEKIVGYEQDKEEGKSGGVSQGGNSASGGDGTASGSAVGGIMDGSGPSNSGPTTMLEGIYDPVSGNVTYGEVFAVYYAQYLEALDAGQIPDELRPYFERYFSALS